jgi:adenylylsulfate kinase
MVIWITGKSSSGKTVYAKRLKRLFESMGEKVLLLDSDIVREQTGNQGYTDTEREKHIMDIAGYAAIAESQGFIVIVAIISPKKEWRMKARKKFEKSMLIYMPDGKLWEGTEYEEPDHEEMMVEG